MGGSVDVIRQHPYTAKASVPDGMIGIGLTMEGIFQNEMIYDLMLESGWRQSAISDIDGWFMLMSISAIICSRVRSTGSVRFMRRGSCSLTLCITVRLVS